MIAATITPTITAFGVISPRRSWTSCVPGGGWSPAAGSSFGAFTALASGTSGSSGGGSALTPRGITRRKQNRAPVSRRAAAGLCGGLLLAALLLRVFFGLLLRGVGLRLLFVGLLLVRIGLRLLGGGLLLLGIGLRLVG